MSEQYIVVILQAGALVIPSLALIMVFIRLGSLIKTVQTLEGDAKNMARSFSSLSEVVTRLDAWREANAGSHNDLLQRVTRLEDQVLRR